MKKRVGGVMRRWEGRAGKAEGILAIAVLSSVASTHQDPSFKASTT